MPFCNKTKVFYLFQRTQYMRMVVDNKATEQKKKKKIRLLIRLSNRNIVEDIEQ